MRSLIALDLDGTLLTSSRTISRETAEALRFREEQGDTVVLATGRPVEGIRPQIDFLALPGKIRPVIAFNGALTKDFASGRVISRETLTGKDARELYDIGVKAGSGIHAFSLRRNLIEPSWNEGNPYTGIEMSYNRISAEAADFHKIPDDEEFMKVMFAAEPEIIDAFVKTPEAENLMRRFTVLRSMPFFLEFLNPRGSKGQSLMLLADDLGIHRENTIAFGDAGNDTDMLEAAGTGIAMANGTEDAKAAADFVTLDNDHDGIPAALRKLNLWN